jgi:GNAT superfamily N-acetyltransferase
MEADPEVRGPANVRSTPRSVELQLEIRSPISGARAEVSEPAASAAWLAELRQFRGRVAWNGGQRPAFRLTDGTFADPDPHDVASYHLILRDPGGGQLAACVRYAPLENLPTSRIREIDAAMAAEIVAGARCADSDVLEGARLMVDPAWQQRGLATELLLAGTALARALDRPLIWGTAGVREGQERVFLRLGYHCAGTRLIPAPHYDDDLRIIFCEPARIPAEIEPRIAAFDQTVRAWLAVRN